MKKIVLETIPKKVYPHFVHYMQYLYWCTDIILNDTDFKYIIIEPENKADSHYVKSYLKKILHIFPNVTLNDKYDENNIYKKYKYLWNTKNDYFILNNENKKNKYINWFPNNNSEKMRNLFLDSKNNNKIRIGLVNRQKNRILTNYKELCENIKKKFNITVDITYFEDKCFDYQIQFYNEHKIIISPHGAQLCSIPFSQDNSLIIECVHEEWHPYYYFPGLSFTSNKYHVMVCDNHSFFPNWKSDKYANTHNIKLNINVNIQKIINIIDIYLKNSNKLESNYCYLI